MTAHSDPIAVVGTSPFAWLLAGLLALDHKRAVRLLGEPPDPYRLWATPALSVAPLTRPQSWALLASETRRAVRRISRIGSGIVQRADVHMTAGSPESKVALSHIRHMMEGFGHTITPEGTASPPGAMRIGDAWSIDIARFTRTVPGWLASSAVDIASFTGKADLPDTSKIVLADDWAVLSVLATREIERIARIVPHLGIETAPVVPGSRRIVLDLESGASLAQSANGSIRGVAPDGDGAGLTRIAACLPPHARPRLMARTRFSRLLPRDGAPVIGPLGRTNHFAVMGLGGLDLLLAPVVARLVVDGASPAETAWAQAHGAGRRRNGVAEFVPDAAA